MDNETIRVAVALRLGVALRGGLTTLCMFMHTQGDFLIWATTSCGVPGLCTIGGALRAAQFLLCIVFHYIYGVLLSIYMYAGEK